MRWPLALCLAVVVLVGGVAFPTPALADAQGTNESNPAEGPGAFGEVQFVLTVYDNGSARWTQRYNQQLSNQTEVQRFRAYADRFNGEETPLYTDFMERATELTGEGSNATGREMNARAFTREARVVSQPGATGVVEMSFLWDNFTASRDGRVLVGDAFENGLYLSSGMALEIRAGPGLEVDWESVEPNPDASSNGSANESDSLTYFGEGQFAGGQPQVAFVPESSMAVDGPPVASEPMMWVAGALLVALILGAVLVRAERPLFSRATDHADPENREKGAETAVIGDAADGDTEGTDKTTSTRPAVTDEELQSDEDRVSSLLEANGGRMRQGAIVEETGWSKSKVSMVLSEMAEEQRVSKLRVGRENIVSLAGHEPEATKSPFDDG